ncbi:hypothetical protein ATERTT37_003199, partial [Aspergillus terreus]
MDADSMEPPGTVQIEEWNSIVLQPPPTDDPDDPLNWSKLRKTVNFTLVLLFTLFTFTLVDIGTVAWGPMNEQLGISFENMNNSFAANLAGLGVCCKDMNKSKASLPDDVPPVAVPKKSYKKRLALVTKTDTPVLQHIVQPFQLLFTFPAVTYTAIMYGSLLCWFSVLATTQSTYLLTPPYNFSASGIGLFNLSTFIGTVLGSLAGGPISDWWIVRQAKLNNGIYEPEMRLWVLLPGIVLCPGGILIFGLCMAR